jgi:hypothetical protein
MRESYKFQIGRGVDFSADLCYNKPTVKRNRQQVFDRGRKHGISIDSLF